ncbi:MAG: hypothetical protein JWQ09_460 [Segetibacter sp.]|nr:hypothetical protein [Segetibacter sp.]
METLLKNDFTAHYGLPTSAVNNISAQTTSVYFELKDDTTMIYTNQGQGIAKYNNGPSYNINVINYETFLKSLSPVFLQHRENCDLIVYTDNNQYFLLNELTDTVPQYVGPFVNNRGFQIGKRAKASSQLLKALTDLMSVPTINAFANNYLIKHCCFFNKQSAAPPTITATIAFNRINTITNTGFRMANAAIESFGFELYEYSGNQIYTI